MKPELDESLLSQCHAPIVDGAKREQATRAMPASDAGFSSLEAMLGGPMELGTFLSIAIAIASALGKVHQHRLVHKDIKPANILVHPDSGEVRFTGFGLSSRMARERAQARPPESIAGTLAYMAPEQTGRMNRSIDSRSDLYALGVTLYQMLTGCLPFSASDPMEWVHCHIARMPLPPGERLENVPAPVSAIIMRLLAKTPEDRYQTAGGVGHDLRRCLAAWEAERRIEDFPLGEHDMPDRLVIPEKLYGRAREIDTLLGAFERVVASGTPELVLVSGYSGIGKSSVVNELHKVLVPPRGLFGSGKFDQYKRDIPYATLAQAFQILVRYLLGKSDAKLSAWRDALVGALGPNGRLMIDLVPELKLIIGDQSPVPDLPPQDARRRFQVVFRRFIGVIARQEHPLALFLDDLQWLDAATLDLLEDLLTPPGVPHLLLIGAYRDNEVTAAHPLMRKLEAIRSAGAKVQEITLAPLAAEDVAQLIADALRCEPERAAPLAQLVREKTAGNPFFLVQFLHTLAEESWLAFDHEKGRWSWDLNRILAKRYRDNVVDLMVGRLNRLPLDTQKALEQLACLGNIAPVRMLSFALGKSPEEVRADLWDAVRLELVEHLEGSYKFVHDRVQEAAYSLIPEVQRDEAHLRIGRRLAAHIPPEEWEEAIFDIVNQYNRGVASITSRDEREQVAELNLLAGKRAKASTAYASALKYLVAGAALLAGDSWERRHELIFALELHRAECDFLTGALGAAEERLNLLSARATNTFERATITRLRLNVYTTLDQSERAVEVCLDYLAHLGVQWLPHPTREQARGEYGRIWSLLDGRNIEELVELPLLSDPAMLGTLDVLTEVVTPALFTDRNLLSLVICRMVNLSLEHGNSDGSCFAYVWLGMIAGPHFDNYEAGFQFGRLGYELVEKCGLHRYQARTYMSFGNLVMPWTRHVRTGRDLVRRAFDAASKAGDLTFAAYSRNNLNTNLLAAGDRLADAQREAEQGLDFARTARFGLVIDIVTAQLGLIRMLRGLTPTFGSFDDEQFDERRFESHLASQPDLALPECWYWIRKLQARVLAGDYRSAIDAASKAQPLLWTSPSFFETAEYEFYGGLARAGFCDSIRSEEQPPHRTALSVHHKQLEIWAAHCPENFESRAALVGAEIARIDGRVVDAEQRYEQAIRSAHEHGFVQNEGLAYELAARFYAARGFDDIAHLYLRRARHCYARWGADGKVRQLHERYPRLREEEPPPDSRATIGEPVARLELATVLKVSQAISGEIVLEKLVDTVLRTAIEHAGAERGQLLLSRGGELLVRAQGETRDSSVTVRLCESPVSAAELPESVVRYAARTREAVILADASASDPYSTDEYIRATGVRSVLCLPLVKQGSLVALLYLENRLASSVFTPSRIALLEVLASQAAISLENSGLYRKLQQREAEVRRLVDANVVGVMIWELEGRILEANDAFLRTVGYERADLVSGRLRWTDLTPAEWRERDERAVAELNSSGTFQPVEKEYFRKDGSRVPVLIGGAAFDEGGKRGVAFVVDLTERKKAEEALNAAKARFEGILAIAEDAIISVDSAQRVVLFNQGAEKVFGYARSEVIGKPLEQFLPQRYAAAHRGHIDQFSRSNDIARTMSQRREVFGVRKNGEEFSAEASISKLDLNGVVVFTVILRDVTERKRAEEELRQSEAYLAEAQKLSQTGSWAWGPDQDISYWSEECYRVLSFDPQDGLPRFEEFFQRIHPDDQPGFRELIQTAIREKAEWEADYRIVHPDGPVRDIHVVGHPVLSTSGHLVEFVGTVIDVTEPKRAEEERRAHLWFLECMDRINRAMQRTNDLEGMMSGVLEETLAIFGSDRARLVYPCDPDALTSRVVMEHTRPEYPGAFALGEEFPVDTQMAELLRRVLEGPGATDLSIPPEMRERFSIQSVIAIAVRPKGDRPYLFGLHQCSHARVWTAAERRLFEEIARRLEDALTSVLAHRNLIASEEELRANEERFRTFVDHATDAFFLYDEECIVLDVNRQACEALGYTREELIGMHPTQFNEDMTQERVLRIKQGLREHGSATFSARRRRKDGSLFPVEERLRAFNRGGRVLGIGFASDITDRQLRERRQLAQYSVTQTLSEGTSLEEAGPRILRVMCEALEWDFSALWRVDADARVLRCMETWSPAPAARPSFELATRAMSFRLGAGLPGRVWSSGAALWIRDVALDPEFPRAESAAKEGLHAAFAFPITLKSGVVGVIEFFSREARDADPALSEMMTAVGSQVGQFIERTQAEDALRHAREKLAQASRIATVAELSASIAHEINQPLQAIVANGHASLRWLDATPPNIEKAIRTAERVVRDGNAAAEVVSRIRALFKHAAPAKLDLDINKLIVQVRTLMADEIQGNGVSLETELGEDLPGIRADAVQIQQVIVNLVRNAIEAMAATVERPKPLWIRSRREGDKVVVEVQDHGVGLADSEKIFEPFITTKETGLGIGLAICRSIVEAHAGRIWAARNPERGVTFSFSLPIENSITG